MNNTCFCSSVKCGCGFGHFDSAGYTQYKYIVGKLDLFALAAKQAMKFAMVSFSTYF